MRVSRRCLAYFYHHQYYYSYYSYYSYYYGGALASGAWGAAL